MAVRVCAGARVRQGQRFGRHPAGEARHRAILPAQGASGTQQAGRNPDRWEDVRDFLPLLSQERWYTRTKRGYARGWEPVRYVDNVQAYLNILQVAGTSATDRGAPPEPELSADTGSGR